MSQPRVFSGIQATGAKHIGNYIGAQMAAVNINGFVVGPTSTTTTTTIPGTPTAIGAPSSVPESVLTIPTPSVAGTPAKYDAVQVRTFGPSSAPHVLVLVPGTNGGANWGIASFWQSADGPGGAHADVRHQRPRHASSARGPSALGTRGPCHRA